MGKNDDKRQLKIPCTGASLLPLDSLETFQGTLKTLDTTNYGRLRASLEQHGFSFPMFVWRSGTHYFTLDGHQRILTLKKMREEGWGIPKLPVDWVEAKDAREAKQKVLLATSQYGKITDEGLYEFLSKADLKFDEMKKIISLPEINMGFFEQKFYRDTLANGGEGPGGGKEKENKCPKCGFKF